MSAELLTPTQVRHTIAEWFGIASAEVIIRGTEASRWAGGGSLEVAARVLGRRRTLILRPLEDGGWCVQALTRGGLL